MIQEGAKQFSLLYELWPYEQSLRKESGGLTNFITGHVTAGRERERPTEALSSNTELDARSMATAYRRPTDECCLCPSTDIDTNTRNKSITVDRTQGFLLF